MVNQWVLPGIVVAVLGIVIGAMIVNQETADNCGGGTGHWHAAYSIWVDGEKVPFANPSFEAHSTEDESKNTHIHGDNGVYHFHPNPSDLCVSWNEAFDHLDAKVTDQSLILGNAHGPSAGTYEGPVNVYQQQWSAKKTEFESVGIGALNANSPANGDAFVILVGEYTQAEVDEILAKAPVMRGNPSYDPHYGT